ncbi:MAG: glycosyltransferase family 2 protein [Acidobacteria bacterium]|nr:glycosyltransferase family 2 protein [Acidobacteriota bacterium]
MNSLPLVSLIVPCRNEQKTIRQCLDSILACDYPIDHLEILVADGMSDDGTREILNGYASRFPAIRMIDNPQKITPTGLNSAIKAARGEIIIRLDAHTDYAQDYVRQCVEVLLETEADNVGGAARTKANGYLQEAISLAFHSPFSAGGARFHDVDYEGYVDTVTYGCWRRDKLFELGLFDEELARNQDDELNLRITRNGGKVWQSPRIRSWYQPRASLSALFRQYSQYGYWKVRVIQKHKTPASWRHLVPGAFVASLILLGVTSVFSSIAKWLLTIELSLYLLANLAATLVTCREPKRFKFIPILPLVFAAYHFGYGYGFLRGLVDFVWLKRGARKSFGALTRTRST